MSNKPIHILRYGTVAEKVHLEKAISAYDYLSINGNSAAYVASAIAKFIVAKFFSKPDKGFFIDPITYAFQNEINLVAISGFKQEHSKALKVYIDDTIEKIAVYNNLIKKLDIFVKTINDKLYNKKIEVSSEFGLRVIEDSSNGKELELNKLSSGEQQIINFVNRF